MPSEHKLTEMENRFYATMSSNSVFSSIQRTAAALEHQHKATERLAISVDELIDSFEKSSRSSQQLAKSLNIFTAGLVIVGIIQLVISFIK